MPGDTLRQRWFSHLRTVLLSSGSVCVYVRACVSGALASVVINLPLLHCSSLPHFLRFVGVFLVVLFAEDLFVACKLFPPHLPPHGVAVSRLLEGGGIRTYQGLELPFLRTELSLPSPISGFSRFWQRPCRGSCALRSSKAASQPLVTNTTIFLIVLLYRSVYVASECFVCMSGIM